MTEQEMFDKAVDGLASQNFERCLNYIGNCRYYNPVTGYRCAWGHVDHSLTTQDYGVTRLNSMGIGIAASLNDDELRFASELQAAHDNGDTPNLMKIRLAELGNRHGLRLNSLIL